MTSQAVSEVPTTRVGVVGAGLMGSALARALFHGGVDTRVWNRTAARCDPLRDEGLQISTSLEDLVAAVDLVIVCVIDPEAANAMLFQSAASSLLEGRTVLNYTSATADAARACSAAAVAAGARYIDGVIMNYPRAIGRADCLLIHAGDKLAYADNEHIVKLLGGASRFIGGDPGQAALLDLSLMGMYYPIVFGFIQGVASLGAAGLPQDEIAPMIKAFQPIIDDSLAMATDMIRTRKYDGDQAALSTHLGGLSFIGDQAEILGIDSAILRSIRDIVQRTSDAGYGSAEIPAVYEIFAKYLRQ
jgi:3-hydroxyisobutyrate dehydrogenase-like beta-hydroxyacid dehydrogenase